MAECYEKGGQTASAWVAWKDAAARAEAVGKVEVAPKQTDVRVTVSLVDEAPIATAPAPVEGPVTS